MTQTAMDWDLSSYFTAFDGDDMRQFKEALQQDTAALRERASALAPLTADNADAPPVGGCGMHPVQPLLRG